MIFKEPTLKDQFWSLDPKLRMILCDIEYYCARMFGIELVVTSLIRLDNKNSVHYYGRGADIRSWIFTPEQRAEITYLFNTKYPYGDPDHQTVLYHKTDTGEWHVHLQVKETTILKKVA